MRRTRLTAIVAAASLMLLLVPQVALATPPASTTPAEIKLSCALVVPNPLSSVAPNRAIVCRWAAPAGVAVRAYRLWRSVDAGPRHLVTTVAADAPLRFADYRIRSGHVFRYLVSGVGADGARVAASKVVAVRVGWPAQALRFNCYVVIDRGMTGALCHWSDTTRAAALRYALYRSVDGGPREAIYRTGEDGRRSFLDRNVKPGQVIRYAVVALDRYGRIVALGGPDRVVIPD